MIPHVVRPAQPCTCPAPPTHAENCDVPFWRANWIRTYRVSRWAGAVPNHLIQPVMRVALDGLEARGMKVLVAHLPDYPEALMGFVAYEEAKPGDQPTLHYLFTAGLYRKSGVAGSLLAASVGDRFRYTHRTECAEWFRRPKYQVTFAPEIARRKDA